MFGKGWLSTRGQARGVLDAYFDNASIASMADTLNAMATIGTMTRYIRDTS